MDSARTPGGLGITVAYFRDEEAHQEWRGDAEHRDGAAARARRVVRDVLLHVAKVERSHGFVRGAMSCGEQP